MPDTTASPLPVAPGLPPPPGDYCLSRTRTTRWQTREVMVGEVGIGGDNPIRVQSMTTTDTEDVDATVRQTLALAEAGCEIVRITAPTTRAARCLGDIRRKVAAAGVRVPLVADIHFAPKAAMEAVRHVDKVRINPGNYADRKKFAVREYSDSEYESELQRLYETFSPIVLECRDRGKAMRIGTNHGSLSDRIMNRFGDTPEGMVQSALEFIRIAESHGFRDIVLSMKASNPKVMIAAYRLAVARMREAGMNYPLHLGVTEAGDGEDGRVKSSIGIGSLLLDGLGDTIRVSLTEDPVHEIPVARDLARRAERLWAVPGDPAGVREGIEPYEFRRRETVRVNPGGRLRLGGGEAPSVITRSVRPASDDRGVVADVCRVQNRFKDARIEGLLLPVPDRASVDRLAGVAEALHPVLPLILVEPGPGLLPSDFAHLPPTIGWGVSLPASRVDDSWLDWAASVGGLVAADFAPTDDWETLARDLLARPGSERLVVTASGGQRPEWFGHGVGAYRLLAARLAAAGARWPLWIRSRPADTILDETGNTPALIEASVLAGSLLCDGLGDVLSVETVDEPDRATALAFSVLQGARARITRTEYVACPSCGRTLFNLEETTRRIRARTNHLKGVTIAVMGCIVNGPGEMADADFGYVGGAPGKVNLYVGKECVKVGIPESEAVDRLVDLIRAHGKWVEAD